MSGILYFVPTPIGNLEDMTFRAIKVLKEVDYILCEDTRTSGILLKHYEISKPLKSYHLHNEHAATEKVIADLKSGQNIAIITDAGTPGISDPGYLLGKVSLTILPHGRKVRSSSATAHGQRDSGCALFFCRRPGRQDSYGCRADTPGTAAGRLRPLCRVASRRCHYKIV